MEEFLRWSLGAVLFATAFIFVLGGFVRSVAGRWQDGDRVITLRQLGPWVRGECARPGGGEIYRGLVFFGRLRLRRFEWGAQHLASIGFAEAMVKLVDGQTMARLDLRLVGSELRGTFQGQRFTFTETRPPRILRVSPVAATERVWRRE